MQAPITLVDDLESLSIFEEDLNSLTKIDNCKGELKTVFGIDCEWKPENFYAAQKAIKRKALKKSKLYRIKMRLTELLQILTRGETVSGTKIRNSLSSMKSASANATATARGKKVKVKAKRASSPVLLLQLSTNEKAWVLDLQKLCRQTAGGIIHTYTGADVRRLLLLYGTPLTDTEKSLDRVLARILLNEDYLKVGLSPASDLKRLSWSYPHIPAFSQYRAVLDLQALAKKAYPGVCGRSIEGLSKLCQRTLNRAVDKRLQCSDWSKRPLTPEQLDYASLDAHILTLLFETILCTMRELPPTQPDIVNVDDKNLKNLTANYQSVSSTIRSLTVGYDLDVEKIASLAETAMKAKEEAEARVALRSTPMKTVPMAKKWGIYHL